MFKIYDLNYNAVSLPMDKLGYGLKGLDISIGPVLYNSIYSESNGGDDEPIKRYPKDRQASIQIMFKSSDTIDWRMKRSEVYTFFRQLGAFYIAEEYEPFKLLKVIVDDDYEFDRPVTRWGLSEIPLKVLKPIFRKSLHTTADIGSEGMLFNNKWSYGMGTWFAENYWQYAFSNRTPTFFNSGTEKVKLIQQKESMITLTLNAVPTNGLIDIDDGTTTFKLWHDFKVGDVIRIHGDKVTLNGVNVLGDTNFNFLTVKTGWNYWDVRGVPNRDYEFKIDFRFLYD